MRSFLRSLRSRGTHASVTDHGKNLSLENGLRVLRFILARHNLTINVSKGLISEMDSASCTHFAACLGGTSVPSTADAHIASIVADRKSYFSLLPNELLQLVRASLYCLRSLLL